VGGAFVPRPSFAAQRQLLRCAGWRCIIP
jgi:hypothetical protein